MDRKGRRQGNRRFVWLFSLLFALCFTGVVCNTLFNRAVYGAFAPLLLLIAAAFLLFLLFCYQKLGACEVWLEKRFGLMVGLFAAGLFTLQLLFGFLLRFEPAFDMQALYKNAVEWAETGAFARQRYDTSDQTYFDYFPNNLGGMAYLALLFRGAFLLGIRDYFAVAMVFNSVMTVGTLCLAALVCKRLFGAKQGAFALLLFALTLPFYFAAPVFYTDFLSMPFPLLTFYCVLRAREQEGNGKKAALFIAAVFAAVAGMLIKFTVVIVVIALVITLLLAKRFKQALFLGACCVCVALAAFGAFKGWIYRDYLDADRAAKYNTPYSHWVMMGLQGNGDYNSEDYIFTRSFGNTEDRDRAIAREIEARIREKGVGGLLSLWSVKGARCFGDGTFALSEFLDDRPEHRGLLHEFILYEGRYYPLYQAVCTGLFLAVLLLMLCRAYRTVLRGGEAPAPLHAAQLCVLGILLFLCLWEAKSRYMINFLPMVYLAAAAGAEDLAAVFAWARGRAKGLCRGKNEERKTQDATRCEALQAEAETAVDERRF